MNQQVQNTHTIFPHFFTSLNPIEIEIHELLFVNSLVMDFYHRLYNIIS